MERVRIAAFDLDGTLLKGQSGTLIVKWLARHHILSLSTIAQCIWWGIRYTLHLPFEQNKVRELIFSDLAHLSAAEIHDIMERFHDEVLTLRYKQPGLAEVARRRDEGCRLALISATFDQIAQVACEHLGFDVALATVMERDAHGGFTGAVEGRTTEGPEKVTRIHAWANEVFGTNGWELVYAYGDHHSDSEMLAEAAHAFAVDPGPVLKREAEKRSWTIVEWDA